MQSPARGFARFAATLPPLSRDFAPFLGLRWREAPQLKGHRKPRAVARAVHPGGDVMKPTSVAAIAALALSFPAVPGVRTDGPLLEGEATLSLQTERVVEGKLVDDGVAEDWRVNPTRIPPVTGKLSVMDPSARTFLLSGWRDTVFTAPQGTNVAGLDGRWVRVVFDEEGYEKSITPTDRVG